MQVSLKEFKNELTAAKAAIDSSPLDIECIQFKADSTHLWIGARGAAVSYTGRIAYSGEAPFRTIYILSNSVASMLLPTTKDDELVFEYDTANGDLFFNSATEQGVVKSINNGMVYADPYTKVTEAKPFCLLRSGEFLKNAIKFTAAVKTGWTKASRPYAAGFMRLAVYDEMNFREEEDSAWPQVCQFLLDDVTYDQEKLLDYSSSVALSLFTTDGSRYYQMFEPIYTAPPHEFAQRTLPFSVLADTYWIHLPVYLDLDDAEALAKILKDEPYRIGIIEHEDRRAMILFNDNNFIWVRLSLRGYPDTDFNRQLSLFHGQEAAILLPNKSFINAVKAICKIESTGKHGLTLSIEDGRIHVSSPETASVVRHGDNTASTFLQTVVVIDAKGFLSAVNTKNPIRIIVGEDFTAIYNVPERSRVVLRNFTTR